MISSKVRSAHTRRLAYVYVRQSSPTQVKNNRESTRRQYALVERARACGWNRDRIRVIDEDFGKSGASTDGRDGFSRLAVDAALGQVGLVLGLEVSRLARNNADWYRLLDLCGLTDTLIGDADGIYHPALYNDRLLLGLKGTMSEAELLVLKGRLAAPIRAKAACGELRCPLPVGYVWGPEPGEVLLHPDEAVVGAVRAVFQRFAEFGSVRQVWLWFLDEGLDSSTRRHGADAIRWAPPTRNTNCLF
jgi:DNA invertase Pin-like site-specific DNA recombinase